MNIEILERAIERGRLQRRLPDPRARRALREGADVTQDAIAKAVGVTRAEVSKWESGSRTPRGEALRRYLKVLDRLRQEVVRENTA